MGLLYLYLYHIISRNSIAKVNFILLTVTVEGHGEGTVGCPCQNWLCERAIMLLGTYSTFTLLIVLIDNSSVGFICCTLSS